MSSRIDFVASNVCDGKMSLIDRNNCSWKPSIGTKGINVKMTIMEGKSAKKKLNARDEALVDMAPSNNPL